MAKMKIGIIGCGTIANNAHIPNYLKNEEVEIKYFCDILLWKAEKCVEKYGCGIAVEDYHEVINDPEIVAVSVCTPNKMHSIISCDALRAGKNVLCEKPAARTYADALLMQEAQHETGKVLNIGVVNRFNSAVNKLREMIQSGEFGEIYHVYVSFRSQRSIPGLGGAFTTNAISGGGVLIDWGVHYLDIVMYCLGDPAPKTVSAKAFSKLGVDMPNYVYEGMWAEDTKDLNGTYDVDDFVTGFVRTEGSTITFNGAWAQNIEKDEMFIDFLGDAAGVRMNYGGNFTLYTVKDGEFVQITPEYEIPDMYAREDAAFLEATRTGEHTRTHIDNILESAKLLDYLYRSAEEKKEIGF